MINDFVDTAVMSWADDTLLKQSVLHAWASHRLIRHDLEGRRIAQAAHTWRGGVCQIVARLATANCNLLQHECLLLWWQQALASKRELHIGDLESLAMAAL